MGRTLLKKKIKEGDFPKPYPISVNKHVWSMDDVQEWIKDIKSKAANDNEETE